MRVLPLTVTVLLAAAGCGHNRANQYSYAPPLMPPVYPQPQAPGPVVTPAALPAAPAGAPVVVPQAAAPRRRDATGHADRLRRSLRRGAVRWHAGRLRGWRRAGDAVATVPARAL